jgi:hypothetical protein
MPAGREPTLAEWAAEEQRLLRLRGERVIAADAAAREEAKQRAELIERHREDVNAPRVDLQTGTPRLTAQQVAETAAAYRANYANCDEELANLMEARLAAALTADGYKVPPRPPADRLRELKARQVR